jgi:23S rRNA (uracil1939-C5)-methyltransferase
MVYGGDGLARLAADEKGPGKAAFVPFVLESERVEASMVEEKPGFVRARADKILTPSPERVEPRCPYFSRCGGCHYQHADYAHQLKIKAGILRETLRRTAKLDLKDEIHIHPSLPWQYRNRTRMQLRAKTGQDFALGYYRFGSHDLLPVEECPISSPLINRAISVLWELGRAGEVSAEVVEAEFFANSDDTELIVELTVTDQLKAEPYIEDFAAALRQAMPAVIGVAVFRLTHQRTLVREDIPPELEQDFGTDELTYRTRTANYVVSAGSFFQTNRYLTDELVALVTGGRHGGFALDLYAGTGLFSLPLSQNFREVAAVESAPFAFHDLRRNCPSNVSGYRTTTETFLAKLPAGTAFDLIIADPPRSGLGEKVARALAEVSSPRITYVSCDPATMARDLRILVDAGFRVEEIHLVDLFPQTYHIESVVQLVR